MNEQPRFLKIKLGGDRKGIQNINGTVFIDGVAELSGTDEDQRRKFTYFQAGYEATILDEDDPDVPVPETARRDAQATAIRAACDQLNSENDDHWNSSGTPKAAVVRKFANDNNITQTDIRTAYPGFSRDAAKQRKVDQAATPKS